MEPPARTPRSRPSPRQDAPDPIGEHAGYLRKLARALLPGQGWEDDVVQQAWLAALARPEGAIRSPRAWLAGAVRHISKRKVREEALRARREQRAAVPERIWPAPAPSAQVEALRRVLDAVDSLADPYRDAIVRRYLGGQSPREIARLAGVAESTVRVWIHRGLKQLREMLDPESDDARRDFLFALAPTAGIPVGALKLSAGAASAHASAAVWTLRGALRIARTHYGWWIMNGKALVSIAAATLIGVSLWIWSGPTTAPATSAPSDPSRGGVAEAPAPPIVTGTTAVIGNSTREVPTTPSAPIAGDWIVRGTCLFRNGDPAAGVPIRLRRFAGFVQDATVMDGIVELDGCELISAADGSFQWSLADPDQAVSIEAVATDNYHSLWNMPYVLFGAAPETIRLTVYPRDATIHGVVVDRAGAPIAGATVTALAEQARTDSAGHYSLSFPSGMDPNWSRVAAHADGHAYQTTSLNPPRSGETVEVNLTLFPEVRIAGVVRDDDGDPLEGVTVWSWAREMNTMSDAEGRYELGHLDATRSHDHRIEAEKVGYLPRSLSVSSSGPLVATADGPVLVCDITLSAGTTLRGRVNDPSGHPIHGARVQVNEQGGSGRSIVFTGRDGTFSAQLERAEHRIIATSAPFAPAERIVDLTLPTTEQPAIELTLQNGHFVGGRVVDERGAPIANAVASIGRGALRHCYASATTDQDGRFRVEGLVEGKAALDLWATGYAQHEETITRLDTEHYQWTLRRAGSIAGRVVDGRTGLPITRFRVRILWTDVGASERAVTGISSVWCGDGVQFQSDDGRFDTGEHLFEVGAVASLQALADGYGPSAIERVVVMANGGRNETTLRLLPALALRGQVVRADTGTPIPDARIREHDPQEGVAIFVESAATAVTAAADGRFVMHVGPGEVTLRVDTPDGLTHIDEPLVMPEHGILPERVIRIFAFGWIEGTLRDGAGTGLAGQKILLRSFSEEEQEWETETDAAGAFRFDGLNRGPYLASHMVRIEDEEARAHTVRVMVHNGQPTRVVLEPDGTASIRGAIQWDLPVPHLLRVSASRKGLPAAGGEGTTSRAVFAIDGQFQIGGLSAGVWMIEAFTWKDQRLYLGHAEVVVEGETPGIVLLQLLEDVR